MHMTATDDSHDIPRDAFGGWVMVAARDLTSDAILAALKAGDFYASTGPDILSITRDGTVIEIETSPVQRIILAADKHHAEPVAGDGITRARFDLKKFDPAFVRIVAIDARGRSAWSNPYWLG